MHRRIEMPAHQLTEGDLMQSPVWRFMASGEALDPDADESYVCTHEAGPLLGEYASYLISATFKLKSGYLLPGFVEVAVLGNRVECTPGAVFAGGKAVEALGKDSALRIQRILKLDDTQPVAWELDVAICGEQARRQRSIEKPGILQALALLAKLVRLHRSR